MQLMEKETQSKETQNSELESFKTPVYLKDNGPIQTSRVNPNCLSLVLNASIHYSPFVCEIPIPNHCGENNKILALNNRYCERRVDNPSSSSSSSSPAQPSRPHLYFRRNGTNRRPPWEAERKRSKGRNTSLETSTNLWRWNQELRPIAE